MKSKFIKIFLSIIIVITFILTFTKRIDVIKADSGWDTDYDSGSSWDSGSDWDSGSSWDDDDYDDSDNTSSGSLDSLDLYGVAFFLIFTLLVIVLIRYVSRELKIYTTSTTSDNDNRYKPLIQEKAQKIIPNLSIDEFNLKSYQIFFDVQMAWMNFDYDKLKNLVTDELYNSYVMNLDMLKIKNQKNTMCGFKLINCYVFKLKEEINTYIAHVYLNVEFYDYIEDTKTGVILRGSNDTKVNNTYILTFIKTKEENKVENCPRCGAPQEGNVTDTCKYCKTKIINETHDWVMSKKEKIGQK